MKKIYLDYAAATPLAPTVLEAMLPYFAENFYNPSSLYLDAKRVSKDINGARARIAKWLGARPSEVIFTGGGTESDNLAIRGIMEKFPEANTVISAVEHEAVLSPAHLYRYKEAPVKADSTVDLAKLEKLIDDQTVLVSIMYANNEVGTIEPLAQIAEIVKTIRARRLKKGNALPLYLHTDACQAANYLHLYVDRLGVDMMTLNAGKIYGPKQVGLLYVKAGIDLAPQILGGGQEFGKRSGTENVPGIIGFAKALDEAQNSREQEVKRLIQIQKTAFKLIGQKIKRAIVNGSTRHRLPNNIHLTIPGEDNERLIMALDEAGIQAAAGSACSASSEEPSHVLRAMGISDKDAQASLRLTMGRQTTEKDILQTIDTLAQLVS